MNRFFCVSKRSLPFRVINVLEYMTEFCHIGKHNYNTLIIMLYAQVEVTVLFNASLECMR